ncbi:MAG: MoaD/ThiS family protein [Candidatus Omnitrophica bacterium]|nr:MoaD/ThiS family protein [Candidatus Omnitrophota bacterium]
MKIKILFFAELREIFGGSRFIDVREDLTVGEVVDLLEDELNQSYSKRDSLIYAVNENFETTDKKLKNLDELALMTPMSGG